MKKYIIVTITSIFFALLFTVNAHAQMDEREPGIYAIIGEESIPLTYSNGTHHSSSTGILGVELGKLKYSYKEPESGITASGTFVLVIDPEKKNIVKNMKAYNPFIKTMTPDNMLVLPLYVDKNKRVYEEGKTVAGVNVSVKDRMDFEWDQISDNSFEIRVQNLIPGEYGFVFRASRLSEFSYDSIFGFTYAGQ